LYSVSVERSLGTRRWAIVGALSVSETVSWGVLYYAFAVVLLPMQRDLGFSAAELTGAFSLGILVAGIAGIGVGRFLDRRGPRLLMTAGSAAGALLVVAWSRVETLPAFYALWVAIGLVMAMVLYEPAFTVLAKWFADPAERRRAMTALTLVAGLASFIFLPLAQALIDAHGWRPALVILAVVLAVITVPLHAVVLREGPGQAHTHPTGGTRAVLRSAPFWLLSAGFFLASLAAFAMIVQAIPFLLDRGHGASFAAFAVGLMGASQIPGRFLFAVVGERLPSGAVIPGVFALVALGIVLIVAVPGTVAVLSGMVVLGMGSGMALLARATVIADRYGSAAYGAIGGVAASVTTGARALAPVTAAVWASIVGYEGLLWTLAGLATLAVLLGARAERAFSG
jgi:predicted MFS family arabinose efflux permease